MKGSRDAAVGTVLAMLICLLAIGVAFFFLGFIKIEEVQAALHVGNDQANNDLGGPKQDVSGQLTEVTHITGVTNAGQPYQPSEVACQIAKNIYDDYQIRGDNPNRDMGGGINCDVAKCLIGIKSFELTEGVMDVSGWEAKMQASPNCHFCQASVAVPKLDEVCMNLNLKDRKVGESLLCSQKIGNPTGIGLIEFGNNKCRQIQGNPAEWQVHCDEYCVGFSNKYDKIIWFGDNVQKTKDTCSDCGGTNENKVADGSTLDDENSYVLDNSPQMYVYGLIWDSSNMRYELRFTRIPKTLDLTADAAASNAFIANLHKDLKFLRYNKIGNWYKEAREVEYVIVKPNIDIGLGTVIGNIANTLFSGKLENILIDPRNCIDENDCRSTKPIKLENNMYIFLNNAKVTIKTGGGIAGSLKSGKTYKISVKNWYNKFFTSVRYGSMDTFNRYDRTISIWCTDC